jgi:hypothetical protein
VVPTIIVELEDAAKTGPNEETRRAPKTARAATEDLRTWPSLRFYYKTLSRISEKITRSRQFS